MASRPTHSPPVRIRAAKARDIDALVELESRVFATDRLSRRSLQRFLTSRSAAFMVAEGKGLDGKGLAGKGVAGTAIVLFRPRSAVARLYSIAVAPRMRRNTLSSFTPNAAELNPEEL